MFLVKCRGELRIQIAKSVIEDFAHSIVLETIM